MQRYHFLPEHSRLWITARSALHPVQICADGVEGYVDLRDDEEMALLEAEPEGRLVLQVERLSSGNRLEDYELRRHVDARRFPTIEGELSTVRWLGLDGEYLVSGDVRFRDVTRRYVDRMRIERVDARMVRIDGTSTIDMRDFGLAPPRVLFFSIAPQVDVRVELVAQAERVEQVDQVEEGAG